MIGIICAMHDEIAELLVVMQNTNITNIGNRNYHHGYINNKEVVVVFSKWGKVAAAITTTQLINLFNPIEIIFTGVAGGIAQNIKIGDIVLGNQFIQHDMDASPIFKPTEIPILNQKKIPNHPNQKLENAIDSFIKDFHIHISREHQNNFNLHQPNFHQGIIASGDQFIHQQQQVSHLKKLIPNLLCVEMEGAAVAQVCFEYQIPFNIIRTISDNANDNAVIDFPNFTKNIASKYAKAILENYCS